MKTSSNTFVNIKFFMFLFYLAMLSISALLPLTCVCLLSKQLKAHQQYPITGGDVADLFLAGLAFSQLLYGP